MLRSKGRSRLAVGLVGMLGSGGAIVTSLAPATAQVIADPSLGTVVSPAGAITGGTTVGGRNLFHSFSRFDVPAGGITNFQNAPTIANIFARVTGGTRSEINGVIQSQGTANLFLINPNGILFGPTALLNVGGSFVATTADALQFGDRGNFSATPGTPVPSLLTIDPSAFLFNRANPAAIENRTALANNSYLAVPNGRSLLLVGGDIRSDGGTISALGGRIELGGLAEPGAVKLNMNGNVLQLQFPAGVARSDVSLENGSQLFTFDAGGGDTAIYARNVSLRGSYLFAGIRSGQGTATSQAGDITIDATDTVSLAGGSSITNYVLSNARGRSGNIQISAVNVELRDVSYIAVGVGPNGTGSGGNLVLNVGSLSVLSDSNLFSSTLTDNDASNILIRATGTVLFDNGTGGSFSTGNGRAGTIDITAKSLILTNGGKLQAATNGSGEGGDINITAATVLLTRGGFLNTSTYGRGNAGNTWIRADTVQLDGTSDTLFNVGNGNTIFSASEITSSAGVGSQGNGGTIDIAARTITVTNGATITAGNAGSGVGGSIQLVAQEDIIFAGGRLNGYFINGNSGTSVSGANVSSVTGSGRSGNIDITARSIFVLNGAALNADSSGVGGGSIRINARDAVNFDGSIYTLLNGQPSSFKSQASTSTFGSGNGGNIEISTGSLSVTNGAQLSSGAFSSGSAGNIQIRARDSVRFDGTDQYASVSPDGSFFFSRSQVSTGIAANSSGNGGNIDIAAKSLFVTNGAQLITSTQGLGNAGNIRIAVQGEATFAGERVNGQFSNGQYINLISGASAFVGNAQGNGGVIDVTAGSLFLLGGTTLDTTTQGTGNAGKIQVNTRDIVMLSGINSYGNGSDISSFSFGASSNAGSLTINTGSLVLQNGASINASTSSTGSADTIQINARDRILLSGKDAQGFSSDILSAVAAGATGNGNTIFINTGNFFLTDDARISALSRGLGNAGNIVINVRDTLRANSGSILTRSEQSAGGNISVRARTIILQGNSNIASSVFSGASNGGNITLRAGSIAALDDSDILAFARDGQGGNITLNTRAFFGQNYRPAPPGTDPATLEGNGRVDVNASGGVAGIITIPDSTFIQNSLTQLSQVVIDTNTLLASSCIVRRNQSTGSFFITGSGGLPEKPGEVQPAFPTGEVRSLEDGGVRGVRGDGRVREVTASTSSTSPTPSRPWKIGDPIVEPQGVYQLPNGELVLSHECPQQREQNRYQN